MGIMAFVLSIFALFYRDLREIGPFSRIYLFLYTF